MALLLGTDIEERVNQTLKGRIARVGGNVLQLYRYKGCFVDDINLPDGGFGRVVTLGLGSASDLFKTAKHLVRQELRFYRRGHAAPRDRRTILLDTHGAASRPDLHRRYDGVISSSMIEHSPNPIWLLLNLHILAKTSGRQFHAIPHHAYTYDRFRSPTSLEHLIADFEAIADESDTTHNDDYIQSAIVKDGWQRDFHNKYPVAYPYMHFHVFNEHVVRALFEFLFTDVTVDVIKTNAFSDNVVLCANAMNPEFKKRYSALLQDARYWGKSGPSI